MKLSKFEIFFLKKLLNRLIDEGAKHLPLLFKQVDDIIKTWESEVEFREHEIKQLFQVVDWKRKKVYFMIYKIENGKLELSRVHKEYEFNEYLQIENIKADKIKELINDSLKQLTDGSEEKN